MSKFILIIILSFASTACFAQEQAVLSDSTSTKEKKIDYVPLSKSTTGAMLRSLAFPGWGQVYVEHYWKSPIFAGAAGFLWYNIISNHLQSKDYQKQLDVLEDKASYQYQQTKNRMVVSIDNRDLLALYLIGVYTLSIIDAYTGAHLYDFDVNQNMNLGFSFIANPLGIPYFSVFINYKF